MGWFMSDFGDMPSAKGWLTIAATAGVLFFGGCSIGNGWNYSEGDKVGVVNKTSKKGAFWKTYEAEMAAEGLVSDGKSSGANLFDFAIDNYLPAEKQEELAKKLQKAMDTGQKVKIHYKEMLCTYPWRSGSSHLIQSIEPVSNQRNSNNYSSEISPIEVSGKGKLEVTLDGREYILRHDLSGKLKVTEMREVQ